MKEEEGEDCGGCGDEDMNVDSEEERDSEVDGTCVLKGMSNVAEDVEEMAGTEEEG